MARMARLVVPGCPHHITQRGSRRQQVFFSDDDYLAYLSLMRSAMVKCRIEVWAYCLMPNHVHWVVVPGDVDSLRIFFSEGHRRYARRINRREGWRGHLWQERSHSFAMDEAHNFAAVRYVEQNPVRADLRVQPDAWRWSSAKAHLAGMSDGLVQVEPMLKRAPDWGAYLEGRDPKSVYNSIHRHSATGRPLGNAGFIEKLEAETGLRIRPAKPGPLPRDK